MKKYYAERNGLLDSDVEITIEQLRDFLRSTYNYFSQREWFDLAVKGIWIKPQYGDEYLEKSQTLSPTPELYFMNCLHSDEIWPIREYYEDYYEHEVFTIIEVLYDHIAYYDYKYSQIEKEEPQRLFAEMVNNYLRWYKKGYYLEPSNGVLMRNPNQALKEMLQNDSTILTDDVLDKLRAAVKMFYRFDSKLEEKRKAINLLADILENVRNELKEVLNTEYGIGKNTHDKMIFDIVNNFGIRHNNPRTKDDYSHEIWFDWMMQYYTSVILTYYKLINHQSN